MLKKISHQIKRAHDKQINSWKAILVSFFVAGFASALILTVSNVWLSMTFGAGGGTFIINQASVAYKDTSGKTYTGQSNQTQTQVEVKEKIIDAQAIPPASIAIKVNPKGKNVNTTTNLKVYLYQEGTTTNPVLQETKAMSTGEIDIDAGSLASGKYDLKIVTPYHLSVWLKGKTFNQGSNLDLKAIILEPKAGNLQDADDIINSLDWQIMSAKWGTNDAVADINKDGVVNTLDFGILNSNWLSIGN